ncbi:MAG: 3-phosphoserine/phosphohydroxythreonine transaminase [Acidobacteria bacterium]|nr:3-phosphoserine/phosphohydroxythreonine transaminase [Acidobacteriota bacterium]
MTFRVFNFYSGPATLPLAVLEKAQAELTNFRGTGMSVMELSHRSDAFLAVLRSAETRLRSLLALPDNYRILFLQGGASLQFSMVPMNFLAGGSADYVVTGTWSEKARKAAGSFGTANVINPISADGYTSVPAPDELRPTSGAKYVHYVSNETIDGVEFPYDLDGLGTPVVCDASSNILSRPVDIENYSLIYAGAQKNIGPSGVTVVIVSEEFLETCRSSQNGVLSYNSFADNESMPNTPNTWGIYIIDLVCEWLERQGGVEAISLINDAKAKLIYETIDGSDGFYKGTAEASARSRMNVTFRLGSAELDAEFCSGAKAAGLVGLKGHRSVGGIRASIYNAFPIEGVERLVEYMTDFAQTKG